jgi:hypothetical protein
MCPICRQKADERKRRKASRSASASASARGTVVKGEEGVESSQHNHSDAGQQHQYQQRLADGSVSYAPTMNDEEVQAELDAPTSPPDYSNTGKSEHTTLPLSDGGDENNVEHSHLPHRLQDGLSTLIEAAQIDLTNNTSTPEMGAQHTSNHPHQMASRNIEQQRFTSKPMVKLPQGILGRIGGAGSSSQNVLISGSTSKSRSPQHRQHNTDVSGLSSSRGFNGEDGEEEQDGEFEPDFEEENEEEVEYDEDGSMRRVVGERRSNRRQQSADVLRGSTRNRKPPEPIYTPKLPHRMPVNRPKQAARQRSPKKSDSNSHSFRVLESPPEDGETSVLAPSLAIVSQHQHQVEMEEEEPRDPYGGYLRGPDADQGDRQPDASDKARFEAAKMAAEARLIGNLDYSPPEDGVSLSDPPPSPKKKGSHASSKRDMPSLVDSSLPTSYPPSPGPGGSVHHMVRGLKDSLSVSEPIARLRAHDTQQPPTPSTASLQNGPLPLLPIGLPSGHSSLSSPRKDKHQDRELSRASSTSAVFNLPEGSYSNIQAIRFGQHFEIKTWYQAPLPEEFSNVPNGRLWICEFCLKYFRTGFQAGRHRVGCTMLLL